MTTTVYATDEDIALRAPADFTLLCPRDQKLAAGSDGVFDSTDRWMLRSATGGFLERGLAPGHVIQLLSPLPAFRSPGESFAIAEVTADAIRLRRKGQSPDIGLPPGPATGLTGVEFLVTTLGPQIELASYDLNRRLGIDDLGQGRDASDLYDPRELREVIVLTVLHRRYLDLSRDASDQRDAMAAKALRLKAELDDVLGRLAVHWRSSGATANSTTTRFSTRMTR